MSSNDNEAAVEPEETEAPGWEAIDHALEQIYGEQEPRHFGTIIKNVLGGSDPLDGISVYESEFGKAHWHYVSYGFSELYDKDSEDLEISGYGFELTMRILRNAELEPPGWPMSVMQNLARYVFQTGNVFEPGHYLDCNGPIALDTGTELRALIFIDDPQLKQIDTAHGRLSFLQMTGITLDELQAVKLWNTKSFAALLAAETPALITDLNRASVLLSPETKKRVDEGIARDGSNTGSLFVGQLKYKLGLLGSCQLTIGANVVQDLLQLMPARLKHGRELLLLGSEGAVELKAAEKFSYKEEGNSLLIICLSELEIATINSALKVKEGEFKIRGNFSIRVLKTEIKNQDGKVVQVLG